MRLLIAVKSEVIADLLSAELSEYDIHICNTGAEALLMLESLHPDLLIIDFRLYGMDGITVLQETHHKPPVILALTDLITNSILELASVLGVQDVILIPCTIRHIVERLEALIEEAPSLDA